MARLPPASSRLTKIEVPESRTGNMLKSSIGCATAFFFTRRFRTTTTLRSTSNYSQLLAEKMTMIDDASLWRRLRGSVSRFFFGRSLPESMLNYDFSCFRSPYALHDHRQCVAVISLLVYPTALRTKRASSEVDSSEQSLPFPSFSLQYL